MFSLHVLSRPVQSPQIHAVTNPLYGQGTETLFDLFQRMLDGYEVSQLTGKEYQYVEGRARALFVHGYGLLQGCITWNDYWVTIRTEANVICVPPQGMDPADPNVILVDPRVPIPLLCSALGIMATRSDESMYATVSKNVYWKRIGFDEVAPIQGEKYQAVMGRYRENGMSVHELLAAIAQRAVMPQRILLPGTVRGSSGVEYYSNTRGAQFLNSVFLPGLIPQSAKLWIGR